LPRVQGAAVDELSGTLKKIKETGVITLGRSEQSVPFSYLGDDGQPIGYSIDLCLRIVDAERAGEAHSVEDPAALSRRGDRLGAAPLGAWLALAAGSSIRRRSR
jgi:ABC-type amino acid transport substrate-binding protein